MLDMSQEKEVSVTEGQRIRGKAGRDEITELRGEHTKVGGQSWNYEELGYNLRVLSKVVISIISLNKITQTAVFIIVWKEAGI